jgi:dCMP deaminase
VAERAGVVIAWGHNGAPEGAAPCGQGPHTVCARLAEGPLPPHQRCRGVHAEARLVASAARRGVALQGAAVYVTHQPCPTCAKLLVEAGVWAIYYLISYPGDTQSALFASEAGVLFKQVCF